MCNTSPLDGNICKVVKLCTFVVLSFMLLKMTGTIGISHYHLYIVLCKRGGLVGCYIATDKPYTTSVNILFYLNN